MIIGIDFDNTIVCYDRLFHKLALKRGLIPKSCPRVKEKIRDFLRKSGKEGDWTELQGRAYGPDILKAKPLEHGIETLGYSFIEKDKRKIEVNKLKKFNLKEGPLIGKLQDGKSIIFKGKKVKADDVSTVIKGRKVTIINDTLPCKNADLLAKNSDLLICEATYSSKLEEKSEEYKHMTAKQAAEMANRVNAKKLALTHFSARYKNTLELEEDARNYFDNAACAEDFMRINL